MKEKDRFVGPVCAESAKVSLRTRTLFERDEEGYLVYARDLLRRWRKNYATPGERRTGRRLEWRKDIMCRVLSGRWLGAKVIARTCNLSRGGLSVLLAEPVEVGSSIACILTGGTGAALPPAEVLEMQPRGAVWLVSARWSERLDQATFRGLLGRHQTGRPKDEPAGEDPGWLMRLWQRFRGAAA